MVGKWLQRVDIGSKCLDIGGKMNLEKGYPLCIIEKHIYERNFARQDGIYFCDEKGNKFISEEEARKHGLTNSEFGATFCHEYLDETRVN